MGLPGEHIEIPAFTSWVPGPHGRPNMAVRAPANAVSRIDMLDWAAARLPNVTGFEPDKAFPLEVRGGVEDHRQAVAVYHEWRGNAVELSMVAVSPLWCRPDNVASILSWPFLTLKVKRITTITPSMNYRALRLNQRLGFTSEGRMRDVFDDGDDAIICGLTRIDWLASPWCVAKEC